MRVQSIFGIVPNRVISYNGTNENHKKNYKRNEYLSIAVEIAAVALLCYALPKMVSALCSKIKPSSKLAKQDNVILLSDLSPQDRKYVSEFIKSERNEKECICPA